MSRSERGQDEITSESPKEIEAPAPSIHLLDDNSDWLLFLFEYLTAAGYQVTASSNIEDAFTLLDRSHPEILIADRDIPGLTEMELIDQIGARSPATRVILTTQQSTNLPSLRWLLSGGVDLLVKPVDWNMLMRAVERAVRETRIWRDSTSA